LRARLDRLPKEMQERWAIANGGGSSGVKSGAEELKVLFWRAYVEAGSLTCSSTPLSRHGRGGWGPHGAGHVYQQRQPLEVAGEGKGPMRIVVALQSAGVGLLRSVDTVSKDGVGRTSAFA